MTDAPLGPALLDYLRARGSNAPDLLERRAGLLPRVLTDPGAIPDGLACRAAVRLLQDAGHDGAPLQDLRARTDRPGSRTPVLLVDRESGGARPAELVLEVHRRAGRGRVVCAGPCDAEAEAAAVAAVAAAATWLRSQGHSAEPRDLDVAWHVPGVASVDGPSLGLPLALAVARSLAGLPTPNHQAATGTIDPHGAVLPVAGLDAKIDAARAAGWTEVLVPPGPSAPPARAVASLADALGTRRRRRRSRLWAPVLAALAVGLGLFDGLEPRGYVAAFRPAAVDTLSDGLVLVTWDRAQGTPGGTPTDFADHRSYRPTHAQVLRNLVDAGATAVAFDAWIAGTTTAGTAPLAAAIRHATARGVPVLLPARKGGADHPWDPPDASLLAAGARPAFSTTVEEGRDRLVRSVRLAASDADGPRWGLAAALASPDAAPRRTAPDLLEVGGRHIPVVRGRVWPRFPATPGWQHLRYADVHAGAFDPDTLRGRRVLVGSTQGLDDQHQTPVGRWYGVQVQAAATDALLRGRAIAPVGRGGRAAVGAAVALLLLALFGRADPGTHGPRRARVIGFAMVVAVGAWADATWLLTLDRWWPWTDAAAIAALGAAWTLGSRR